MSKTFIVENAGNTCYIDSLLMALFYTKSHIDGILTNRPKDDKYIYIQEYIKMEFIERVRNNKSVLFNVMNNLRYVLIECGWKDLDEFIDQQDVSEFYTFLADIFNITVIEMKRHTFYSTQDDRESDIEKIPFIPLSIPFDHNLNKPINTEVTIKDMLYNWLYNNDVTIKNDKQIAGLNVYHIQNIPEFVCISINRFVNASSRLDVDVIIQKRLCPFKNTGYADIQDIEWCFHSAVCHRGATLNSGHYYTLLRDSKSTNNGDDDCWYIFNDLDKPSIKAWSTSFSARNLVFA